MPEQPAAPAAPAAFGLQDRIIAFVRAFRLHQPDETPCGQLIGVSEAHALGELGRDGPLSQHELRIRLRLEKSTVSRLVAQLESRGWLHRRRHDGDGRVVWLELSAAGRKAAAELAAARTAKLSRLLDQIPARDRQTVLDGMTILTEALNDPLDHTPHDR